MKPLSESVVLIVDDEIGVTRLCQRLLARAGYQVVAVHRPQEAIDFLEREHVDLMLADIRMPEMDGFQLMEAARRLQPELAVVMMTGYGTVDTAVESLRQGADGMVLKPFTGAEVVQSVEQALREKHRQQEIQRLQVLRPLFDITESLFSEKDPERLKHLIVELACEHLACAYVSYYVQEKNGYHLVAECGHSLGAEVETLLPQVVTANDPLILGVGRQANAEVRMLSSQHGLGPIICIPNTIGRNFSVMLVGRAEDQQPFSDPDLEMAVLFSRQAAIALESAQLYSELQDHVLQIEKSQQALIQAEKMAAVGRLTASIAHEINNPLQSVHNCLHLIEHGDLSEEEKENYFRLATDELDRLMKAAKRMLDYYRPGALDHHPVNINVLVARVLQLLDAQIKGQNIHIHTDLAGELPEVMAVGNQIQQVIFNIVLNAMEAMPDGGELFIKTSLENRHVIILIEDTGPGVAEAERENIFEPFMSTKNEGLGLGLTVSYGIVTAHSGTLELLSPYDQGARFQITLPIGG